MDTVSQDIQKKIKELRVQEGLNKPQPDLLIALPNSNPNIDYSVSISTAEFTSLCPLNLSQPDYATITINYKPNKLCVELKSLKFYLSSFRNIPVFHESVPATILEDLCNLLSPVGMVVRGDFTTRGGIDTVVIAKEGVTNYIEYME